MNWSLWQQIEWRAPAWLLIAMMPLLFHAWTRWRVQQWTRYAEPHLQEWAVRKGATVQQSLWRILSDWLFWIFIAIALAGPRLPLDTLDGKRQTRHDIDLMVVLDVSTSMTAVDVIPSRLARAKLELQELLSQLRGERLGLIVYSGESGLLLPLTHDMAAFQHSLALADESLFNMPGTNLGAALRLARRHLSNTQRTRAILLVSDSESSSLSGAAGEIALQATHALKAAGIPVYVFTIASEEGGAVPESEGSTLQQLEQVYSRPDIAGYRTLAALGGGRVITVRDDDRDLNALYAQGILHLPTSEDQLDKTRSWRELFAYPLALAILLLLITHLRWSRRGLLVVALTGSAGAQADDARWREAYAAYTQKQFLLAQQHYRGLAGYQARMGEGAAAYRRKDFIYATRQFTQALLLAHTANERADALLNIGNSFFYVGNLRAASDAFAGVLRYRNNDPRALENLARVRSGLRQRNAMMPQQDGIPGRKGRGLGQAVNNAESSRGIENEKDDTRLLDSLNLENAAEAKSLGEAASKKEVEVHANRRAALKKLELLGDHRVPTIKQILKQDASSEAPPDMPPW